MQYIFALQCFPFLMFLFLARPQSQSNNLGWYVCHHPGHHDSLAQVFNTGEIVLYERLTKVSPCDHNNGVPCWVYSCKHPVLTQPKHPAGGSALCTGGVLYLTVHHCTSLYCTAGRPSTVRHQGQPRQSVNSRLATSEECRDYSRD